MEEFNCLGSHGGWTNAPREVLLMLFKPLPLKDRCRTVSSVCEWWRRVALESEELLPDLNLNSLPGAHDGFIAQRDSFIAWLKSRLPHLRACILQAELWEDDGMSLHLRGLVAQILGPHLRSLKLISTGGGKVTSMFMAHGASLRQLSIDFYGANNGLARQLGSCSALTSLRLQCSSGLGRYEALGGLTQLRELEVVDSDWRRVPSEVVAMCALTRLSLRFADLEGSDWLPASELKGEGGLCCSLRCLVLHACQVAHLPEGLFRLTVLTSLSLDRNSSLPALPEALSKLAGLESLSLEGCSHVRQLGEGAVALPLRTLNLNASGVTMLPEGAYTSALETLHFTPSWMDALCFSPHEEAGAGEVSGAGGGPSAAHAAAARAAFAQVDGEEELPAAAAAVAAKRQLVSALSPAWRLREVVIGGKPRAEAVRRAAGALFAGMPSLEAVSAPAAGQACRRSER